MSGERLVPNRNQWLGTRFASFRGNRMGTSRHALQYSAAARDSIERIASMLSILAKRFRRLAIELAVLTFCNFSRINVSCPLSFAEMSSRAIFTAVPLPNAKDCALRSRASLGAVGPVTTCTLPRRFSITNDASTSLNHLSAESVINPSSPMQTRRFNL